MNAIYSIRRCLRRTRQQTHIVISAPVHIRGAHPDRQQQEWRARLSRTGRALHRCVFDPGRHVASAGPLTVSRAIRSTSFGVRIAPDGRVAANNRDSVARIKGPDCRLRIAALGRGRRRSPPEYLTTGAPTEYMMIIGAALRPLASAGSR